MYFANFHQNWSEMLTKLQPKSASAALNTREQIVYMKKMENITKFVETGFCVGLTY